MTGRVKMPREERAKQFMPFAALKGYEDELQRTEEGFSIETVVNEELEEYMYNELLPEAYD